MLPLIPILGMGRLYSERLVERNGGHAHDEDHLGSVYCVRNDDICNFSSPKMLVFETYKLLRKQGNNSTLI